MGAHGVVSRQYGNWFSFAKMAAEEVNSEEPSQKKTCSKRCDELCKSIWNKDKQEFLGRTGISWGTLFVKRFLI